MKRNVNCVLFKYRVCSSTGGQLAPVWPPEDLSYGEMLFYLIWFLYKNRMPRVCVFDGREEKRQSGRLSRLTLRI